jgi:energy-converting hydrogenase A subunit R
MEEFDPAAELGLEHDKQLICSSNGFLQFNNSCRDLCQRFISKGDRLYDLISRYDDIVAYVLNRSEGRSGITTKLIAPFLRAFGMTDFLAMEHCRNAFKPMPEAKRVIGHLMDTLPTFITTSSYEHNVMSLCENLDIPRPLIDCMEVEFDFYDMARQEMKALKEATSRITSLRLPSQEYELDVPTKLQKDELEMVMTLDEIFFDKFRGASASNMMRELRSIGANEKAYFLLDLRKRTEIGFDGTAFIGGDITDIHALETISDGGGLAMSFNGCDFAVRKSNIAVMSRDCTPAAVLVQEFYNEGIHAVYDLVENWNHETLKKKEFPDPHLMSAMLASYPKKLPEVRIVTRKNVSDIAKKSDQYRKKLFNSS